LNLEETNKSVSESKKEHEKHHNPTVKEMIEEEIDILEICLDSIVESKTHGVSNIIKAKSKILKLIWFFACLQVRAIVYINW